MSQNPNDEIVRLAGKAGAEAAIAAYAKEQKQAEKEKKSRYYLNIKKLLENYRGLKAYAENAVQSVEDAVYASENLSDIESIIQSMWDPYNRSDALIESIKESKQKTLAMITHIEAMLKAYEKVCFSATTRQEDKRRYQILYDRYISDEGLSVSALAKKYSVDERTVYSDLKTAATTIAAFMFGVDYVLSA